MRVLLTSPRGFCAGVERAISIVERALALFGPPVYVRHEIVHNTHVVCALARKGARFVRELSEVPSGELVVFSAHGVARAVREEAARRGLRVLDATCPLVTKVHSEVAAHAREGREVVVIGHSGHAEVVGTMGSYDTRSGPGIHLAESARDVDRLRVTNPERLAYVTQTTLSMDDTAATVAALRRKFPRIVARHKDDICYATENRQQAVKALAPCCDAFVVVGSPSSANSNRLRELAAGFGIPAYLVDSEKELERGWFEGKENVGLTSGASVPEVLVTRVLAQLIEWGAKDVEAVTGVIESVRFRLPRELEAELA